MSTNTSRLVSGTVSEVLTPGRFRVRTESGGVLSAVASIELAVPGRIAAGDRVSVVPAGAGSHGVIVRVEAAIAPPLAPQTAMASAPAVSSALSASNSEAAPTAGSRPSAPFGARANRVSPDTLKIDRMARPDWPTGAERTPQAGEEVYCTEGLCTVMRVLGRTGNGSRLLELRLDRGDRRPFFAAASNVLVHPLPA